MDKGEMENFTDEETLVTYRIAPHLTKRKIEYIFA